MASLIWCVASACAAYWLFEVGFLVPFCRRMRRPSPVAPAGVRWPKIFVSVPLRGADATLSAALRNLLAQDYPNFEVHIVVDHETDPAWEVVRAVIAETGATNVVAANLRNRSEHCSLLCSSLRQVFHDVEHEDGLLTFCGADMHPRATWLREMATIMADPQVGAPLGNRWYAPPIGEWGSLVQYLWNLGAMLPMWFYEIPWGGTLALRIRDIRESNLAEQWGRGMVEDAPVKGAIRGLGLRFHDAPQLLVVDRGEASLSRAFHFICRQLLWTRLYHPNWPGVLLASATTTAIMFAPFVAAIVALFWEEHASALLLLGIGVSYVLGSALLGFVIDRSVRKSLLASGERVGGFSPTTWLRLCAAIPLTQVMHALATIRASLAREMTWRGVRYRLDGPWDVRMVEYRPMSAKSSGSA